MDGIRGWLREFRAAAGGYEDQQLRQAFPGLSSGAVRAAALGALQTAAGALARALATAAVTGARGALTAETLYAIGYDLVRHGQYVALLQIQRDGAARLLRADANSPTYGGPDRESWRYTLTLGGPSHTRTLTAPADTVAHVIWNSASITPWRGRSPLAVASASSELAARINQSLSDESNIPVSRSIPMPYGTTPEDGNRWVGWFIEAAASHRRGMIFPESTRPARGQGVIAAPTTDWKGNRIGSDIPESSVKLHALCLQEVGAACGIPPVLMPGANAAGPAMREGHRQLLTGTVQPLSGLIASELSRVLESEVVITFDELAAADLIGRARALGTLVKAKIPLADARELVGWSR